MVICMVLFCFVGSCWPLLTPWGLESAKALLLLGAQILLPDAWCLQLLPSRHRALKRCSNSGPLPAVRMNACDGEGKVATAPSKLSPVLIHRCLVGSRFLCSPGQRNARQGSIRTLVMDCSVTRTPGWSCCPLHWELLSAEEAERQEFTLEVVHIFPQDLVSLVISVDGAWPRAFASPDFPGVKGYPGSSPGDSSDWQFWCSLWFLQSPQTSHPQALISSGIALHSGQHSPLAKASLSHPARTGKQQ